MSAAQLKATVRRTIVFAAFFCWLADNFRKQRLDDQARFRMTASNRGKRAAVSQNHFLAVAFTQGSQAAEVAQHFERDLDPLTPASTSCLAEMIAGHSAADFAHRRADRAWTKALRHNAHKMIQQRAILFRKNVFRFVTEAVGGMRLSGSRPRPALPDQSVALQTNEMRSDRVIGQLQDRGQVVHGSVLDAEERENPSAG